MPRASSFADTFRAASRALCVGIGGGGDVVGALAVADCAARFDTAAVVGGITWERLPVDPLPGPRRAAEVAGAEPLNEAVMLAGPDTTGPGGFRFAESHVAGLLGERTVLVDPWPGPRAVAAGLDDACARLGCDLVVLVDVGGDVLAHGDEAGLGSPLADAVLVAAGAHLRTPALGAVFGPGCDGELTPAEVLDRIAEVAAAGGLAGAWGLSIDVVERLEAAVAVVPTEASAQALLCARGRTGPNPIRNGRRTVHLSPVGALTFFFDPAAAMRSAARLATAVAEAPGLEEANTTLNELGVRTELDWERVRSDR